VAVFTFISTKVKLISTPLIYSVIKSILLVHH